VRRVAGLKIEVIDDVSWRRIVALGIPIAVLAFAMGFIVALEVRRGPDWRLELEEYIAEEGALGEAIRVEAVVGARKPWNFTAAMGSTEQGDRITPAFPPQAVRCALLVRRRESDRSGEDGPVRQVVFLIHHSDALYRVGWVAYEGPEEPFGLEVKTHLERIGCDLRLD
jgi:hypothetical protein